MIVDLKVLKAQWREKATERGINVEEGATSYQVATFKAEQSKASHNDRMAAQVAAAVIRRPLNFDNGRGAVNTAKVLARQSPDWWQDEYFWRAGQTFHRPYERLTFLYVLIYLQEYERTRDERLASLNRIALSIPLVVVRLRPHRRGRLWRDGKPVFESSHAVCNTR